MCSMLIFPEPGALRNTNLLGLSSSCNHVKAKASGLNKVIPCRGARSGRGGTRERNSCQPRIGAANHRASIQAPKGDPFSGCTAAHLSILGKDTVRLIILEQLGNGGRGQQSTYKRAPIPRPIFTLQGPASLYQPPSKLVYAPSTHLYAPATCTCVCGHTSNTPPHSQCKPTDSSHSHHTPMLPFSPTPFPVKKNRKSAFLKMSLQKLAQQHPVAP